MAVTINAIKKIIELVYVGVGNLLKTHQIAVQKTGDTTITKCYVSDITDIAVAEAKIYTDSVTAASLIPKGQLYTNFACNSIEGLSNYWAYSVQVDDIRDTDLDESYKRGIIYWYDNNWVVFAEYGFASIYQSKISELTGNYDPVNNTFDYGDIDGLQIGWIYYNDKTGAKDVSADQTLIKGLYQWNGINWTLIYKELSKSQVFENATLPANNIYVITEIDLDVTATIDDFLIFQDGAEVSNRCSLLGNVLTYNGTIEAEKIKVLYLK
jgi:hypothetical protein